MTQKLRFYRVHGAGVEDDRRLARWFDVGTEPELLTEDGVTWERVPEKLRDSTVEYKKTISGFKSVQLPKWYKYALRHDENGACVFFSRTEAEECARRAGDAGEPLKFDY